MKTKKEKEEKLLAKIKTYVNINGYLPLKKEDKTLYYSIEELRRDPENISNSELKELIVSDKYSYKRSHKHFKIIENKIKSVIEFIEKNNRIPEATSPDKEERYLRNECLANKEVRQDPTVHFYLKKYFISKLLPLGECMDIVYNWIKTEKRWPSQASSDPIEKKYYEFIKTKLEKFRKIYKDFDELESKYRKIKLRGNNKAKIDNFKRWCEKHDKFPNSFNPCDQEERRLGMYMYKSENYTFTEEEYNQIIEIAKQYGYVPKKEKAEIINKSKREKISEILLNKESLAHLDKPQLLSIVLLDCLEKQEYEEILNSPKGEKRIKLIEKLSDKTKNYTEEKNENSLENNIEDLEIKEDAENTEEKEFEEKLHLGLEEVNLPTVKDPRESMKTLYKNLKSIDSLEGYYRGEDVQEYIIKAEIQKLLNIVLPLSYEETMNLVGEYLVKKSGQKIFNETVSRFLNMYQEAVAMKIPEGYSFKVNGEIALPLLMQKLTAYLVKTYNQFANWSETGTGKTISGVLTSRVIDSRITLVIAVNATISNWTENSIRSAYPNSKVYTKNDISKDTKLDKNFYNYVVVNYEEFQNPNKFFNKWKPFVENNKVDFVVLDEVQKVKALSENNYSIRREVIENLLQEIDLQHGRDLKTEGRIVPVLALSATPVINNLNELVSILSLMTGKQIPFIKRLTRLSMYDLHYELVRNGIRLVDEPATTEKVIVFPIKKSIGELAEIKLGKRGNMLTKVDVFGCLSKLDECRKRGYLQKGVQTIIYTELVNGVIDVLKDYLKTFDYKVGEYTGRNSDIRNHTMEKFLNKELDIIIASKPISTGVDGLQTVCNRLIILIPAWTYSEYHQLVGRLNRRGTAFSEIEIIIPTINYVGNDGDVWSLDNNRLSKIKFKKSLSETVMTGYIPDKYITLQKLKELAEKSLMRYLEAYKQGKCVSKIDIPILAAEIKPTEKPRVRGNRDRRDYWSELQDFNQLISASTTEHIFSNVIKTKEDWLKYHELRNNSVRLGDIKNQPIYTIARDFLKSKKPKVLGDMGCGMNLLRTLLPENYNVISVDWYAADETVKTCNLQDTSSVIGDGELDVAVYSLSFWGKDWKNVLKDAYRILDYDGRLIIVQPISSEARSIEKVEKAVKDAGFINIQTTKDAIGKYYYMIANK